MRESCKGADKRVSGGRRDLAHSQATKVRGTSKCLGWIHLYMSWKHWGKELLYKDTGKWADWHSQGLSHTIDLKTAFLEELFYSGLSCSNKTFLQRPLLKTNCVFILWKNGADTLRLWVSQASAMEWLIFMFLKDCVLFFQSLHLPPVFWWMLR